MPITMTLALALGQAAPARADQPGVCRVTGSTGSDPTDVAACRYLESRPYRPPVDIFGRKVEGRLQTSVSFDP